MGGPSWALSAAIRQVTILEVLVRCAESPDSDMYDVAGVVADLLERGGLDPAATIVNYIEMKSVLDDDDYAAARDAVRDIARAEADAARSAARLNQRSTQQQQSQN